MNDLSPEDHVALIELYLAELLARDDLVEFFRRWISSLDDAEDDRATLDALEWSFAERHAPGAPPAVLGIAAAYPLLGTLVREDRRSPTGEELATLRARQLEYFRLKYERG